MEGKQQVKRVNLEYVMEKIGTGVLMYFEVHKELLEDPDFYCAYKIARDAYIKRFFSSISVNLIEKNYLLHVEEILQNNQVEVIEGYTKDAYSLVDIVKRYNIAGRYDDIFDRYNQQ